jgi:hypothetical protein
MPPLERLFLLEIDYHHTLRCDAPGTPESAAPHISYAMQHGYEPLFRRLGYVTADDLTRLYNRLIASGDARDVIAAHNSLMTMLRLWPESE